MTTRSQTPLSQEGSTQNPNKVVPAAHLASCFTYVTNLLRSQKQEKNDGIVTHR